MIAFEAAASKEGGNEQGSIKKQNNIITEKNGKWTATSLPCPLPRINEILVTLLRHAAASTHDGFEESEHNGFSWAEGGKLFVGFVCSGEEATGVACIVDGGVRAVEEGEAGDGC